MPRHRACCRITIVALALSGLALSACRKEAPPAPASVEGAAREPATSAAKPSVTPAAPVKPTVWNLPEADGAVAWLSVTSTGTGWAVTTRGRLLRLEQGWGLAVAEAKLGGVDASVVYATEGPDRGLWLACREGARAVAGRWDQDRKTVEVVPAVENPVRLAWDRVHRVLYFTDDKGRLFRLADDGAERLDDGPFDMLAVSPDGERLVARRTRGPTIPSTLEASPTGAVSWTNLRDLPGGLLVGFGPGGRVEVMPGDSGVGGGTGRVYSIFEPDGTGMIATGPFYAAAVNGNVLVVATRAADGGTAIERRVLGQDPALAK
jgi:hypothetical protein